MTPRTAAGDPDQVAAPPRPPVTRELVAIRPGLLALPVAFTLALTASLVLWPGRGTIGITGWATTVLWTLPTVGSLLGILGAVRTTRRLRRASREDPMVAPVPERLVVVIPTIGRPDTLPALRRVIGSCAYLAPLFPDHRIDVVVEEGCPAAAAISAIAAMTPSARVLTVPRDYATRRGTRFKARANQYALAHRENRAGVWVLHLDDDTAIGPDTAGELARFVTAQRGPDAKHLGQGVLTYPRELGANRLLWLADAIRPAGDVSTFAATTGLGTPRAGLHGELLLVRASVEAEIGWDFGPRTMVEDAHFALEFARRHPGRSDWFPGRCFGATPATVAGFVVQRERWAWGLLELAFRGTAPLRHRILLLHNVIVWSCLPLQHIGVVLLAGWMIGDTNTQPAVTWLLPVWAMNLSYNAWSYWTGLRLNATASVSGPPRWWERLAVVAGIPLFSLLEAAGVARGVLRFVRRDPSAFPVIAKPL